MGFLKTTTSSHNVIVLSHSPHNSQSSLLADSQISHPSCTPSLSPYCADDGHPSRTATGLSASASSNRAGLPAAVAGSAADGGARAGVCARASADRNPDAERSRGIPATGAAPSTAPVDSAIGVGGDRVGGVVVRPRGVLWGSPGYAAQHRFTPFDGVREHR